MNQRQKRYVVLDPRGQKYHEMRDETHTVCGLRVSKAKHILIEPPSDATLCRPVLRGMESLATKDMKPHSTEEHSRDKPNSRPVLKLACYLNL